jgi:Kef-type K+ transport system membrane component KefB
VNAIWLLMGLLVLSYIGSFLVGGHALRNYGLPSGAEYVVLGFLLGPSALGLVERSTLATFQPVADVALGWLALVVGLGFGFVGERRVRPSRVAAGVGLSLLAGGAVALPVWLAAGLLAPMLAGRDRLILALGVGAACAETTRHAVTWVMERHRASGPLSSLIADLADSDDFGPILLMGAAFALAPAAALPWHIPIWGWTGVTLALGVALGLIAVVLLGSDFRLIQSWGVLLGTSLLTIGTAARLGMSPLLAAFAMGVTIAGASRLRDEVLAMVAPSERPVLLPMLLLAGAHINPPHLNPLAAPYLLPLAGVAIAARLVAKLVTGLLVRRAYADARGTGAALGLGLLSCGAVSMSVGLAFALRFPGPVGDAALLAAAVATVLGEFAGPAALRAVLRHAGEIAPASEEKRPAPRPAAESPVPPSDPVAEPGTTPVPRPGGEPASSPASRPAPEEGGQ